MSHSESIVDPGTDARCQPVVRRLLVRRSSSAPRYWCADDAFGTHLFNALSLMFPDGERYFVDAVRPYVSSLRDPGLCQAAHRFIAQELAHRHAHAQFNDWLAEQGVRDFVGPVIRWRIRLFRRMAPRSKLALTAAMEHLTAVFADGVLRHPHWCAAMEPSIRPMWGWHAVEEIEHKAVAFDIYREAGGGGLHRAGWFLYACLIFSADLGLQLLCSLQRDRQLWRSATWRSAWHTLFGLQGMAGHLAPRALAYLRKGFHPWQERNESLIEQWLHTHAADYREMA